MEYKLMFQAVKKIISEWDPRGLLELGAPSDEYDHEIRRVIAGLRNCNDKNDIARLLINVFNESFDDGKFEDKESVGRAAVRIFQWKKSD